MSMHNGGGASNSQGTSSSGPTGPVSIIIDGSRLNEEHQLLNP